MKNFGDTRIRNTVCIICLFMLFTLNVSQIDANNSDIFEKLFLPDIKELPGKSKLPVLKEIPDESLPTVPYEPQKSFPKPYIQTIEETNRVHKQKTGKEVKKIIWWKVYLAYPSFGLIRDLADIPFSLYDGVMLVFGTIIDKNKNDVNIILLFGPPSIALFLGDVICLSHINMFISRIGTGDYNLTYKIFKKEKETISFFPNLRSWKFTKLNNKRLVQLMYTYNKDIDNDNEIAINKYKESMKRFEDAKEKLKTYEERLISLNAKAQEYNEELDKELANLNLIIEKYNKNLEDNPNISLTALNTLYEATKSYGEEFTIRKEIIHHRRVITSMIQERNDWDNALKENSIIALNEFLSKYPEGFYKEKAKKTIAEINTKRVQEDFEKAVKDAQLNHNPAPLITFIEQYPTGEYRNQAEIEIQRIVQENEDTAFNQAVTTAKTTGKIKSLKDFLQNFPNSKRSNEAKDIIWELAPKVTLIYPYRDGKGAPINKKPDESSSVLTSIPDGKKLILIKKEGNWFYVEWSENKFGYVHKEYVKSVVNEK